jgi:hypothetical protein
MKRFVGICGSIALPAYGLALVLLTGCISSPTLQYPPFPNQAKRIDDPSKARVYVMRPGSYLGEQPLIFYGEDWAATGPVFDPTLYSGHYDKARLRRIGEIGGGGYICWETPPHPFRIEKTEGETNSVFTLNLLAGNVYYLKATANMTWTRATSSIEVVPEEEGIRLLKQCKPPNSYRK